MTPAFASIVWAAGIVAWLAIRLPRRRKAKRTKVVADQVTLTERATLTLCIIGLFILPLLYLTTDWLDFANLPFRPLVVWFGTMTMAVFIALFYFSHKQLDRNWSVTLEVREGHKLVDHGLYARMRHPMYTSFWLWGIAQMLLFPNWMAGLSGLISVAILYFSRVQNEEAMMRTQFGETYDEYCAKTPRLIPRIF